MWKHQSEIPSPTDSIDFSCLIIVFRSNGNCAFSVGDPTLWYLVMVMLSKSVLKTHLSRGLLSGINNDHCSNLFLCFYWHFFGYQYTVPVYITPAIKGALVNVQYRYYSYKFQFSKGQYTLWRNELHAKFGNAYAALLSITHISV